MSLKHINQKIKHFYQEYVKKVILLWFFLLILINSFILGFLYDYNNQENKIEIEFDSSYEITKNDLDKGIESVGEIYASKNGSKYYFDWCGSSRIKDENKIFFKSENEAREEGYEISAGCNN